MVLTPAEYKKKFPKDDEFRQDLTKKTSEKSYIPKMMKLIDDDPERKNELRGYVHDVELPNHLMYRVDTLYNPDGYRFYEFLIEYNEKKPAEGIYYGCRGLTKEGFDHNHAVKLFQQEWDEIKGRLCQVLNNIFPEKDFSVRFKDTDNANTNTYWLFWISLYEDEDIKKVGLVATGIIRDVFKYYLKDRDWFKDHPLQMPDNPKTIVPKMAFYNQNYETLLEEINYKETFTKLLQRFEEEGWIEASPFYEKAWIFKGADGHRQNVDFIQILKILQEKGFFIKDDAIPWILIQAVFLNSEGYASENLRQQAGQVIKKYIKEFWENELDRILQEF